MPSLVITPKPTPVGFTVTTQVVASHSESVLIADFGSIPPEINSARMYAGPGPDSLLTAAATWDGLAAELYETAGSHHAVASRLTGESWLGPASTTMTGATTPYLAWLHDTAALAAQTAQHARAAVAAYDAARAMTVPPSVVAANRAQLATLATANTFGLNAHELSAVEAQYREMWAQDSTAMYMYAETSANASSVVPFLPPPGTVGDTAAPGIGGRTASSTIVHALHVLASPAKMTSGGHGRMGALALAKPIVATVPASGTVGRVAMTARLRSAVPIGALSAPRGWLTAAGVSGSAATTPGAWSAAPISATPPVPMMPVRSTATRGVDTVVSASRTGLRTVIHMRSRGD